MATVGQEHYFCRLCGNDVPVTEMLRCDVCLKKRCPNCVVRIAGKLICGECKKWALNKLEHGLPLKPDATLFLSMQALREKRRRSLGQRVREAAGGISGFGRIRARALARHRLEYAIGAALLAVGLLGLPFALRMFIQLLEHGNAARVGETVPGVMAVIMMVAGVAVFVWQFLDSRHFLNSVEINERGIVVVDRHFRTWALTWEDLRSVTVRNRATTLRLSRARFRIHSHRFPSYWAIVESLRRGCAERGIEVRERKSGE